MLAVAILFNQQPHEFTPAVKSDNDSYFTFVIISLRNIGRMRNVSNESCTENQNTYFAFSDLFSENRAVYEIMRKDILERGGPLMAV